VNDLAWTLDHLYAKFGPVADVGYRVPIRLVYLMGVEANRYILAEHPENFTWREAFSLLEVVDGPTALVLSDGEEHRRRRRLVQPGFATRRVDGHLELVTREIDATLATWTAGRSLNAMSELRAAVRRIVIRALFGDHLGGDADRIGELLEPALQYVGRTPLSRLDINLSLLPYGRAVRASAAVDAIVMGEIARRRRGGVDMTSSRDVLSALLVASQSSGERDEPLSDGEICDQIRSLIAAGYDTTSSAAAWLVHGLGADPTALERLRTQVRDTIGEGAPTLDDLRAMPLVDGVVRETLRLWSPAAFSGRRALEDFELYGYRIPGASMVMYSPYITHRLPEVWGDPLAYRPERWKAGEPVPFSFVPFGGGYRKCIGFALATLELQVLAVRLAQRITFQLDNPNVRAAGIANFSPKGGLPITVTGP
jgi:cytochrome P450